MRKKSKTKIIMYVFLETVYAKKSYKSANAFFRVSDEFQYFTLISTIVMTYRNRDSQNGNVYTRNTRITMNTMSAFEVPLQLKRKIFSVLK